MTTSRIGRRLAALTLAAVTLLSVTACTGAPTGSAQPSAPSSSAGTPRAEDSAGDQGQSTADACRLIQDTIEQASAEFDNVSNEDPAALVDAMEAAAQQLADASSQITNDEVAALLPSLQQMFSDIADVMGALAEGDASRIAEVQELGASFQETSTRFQELCAP